MTPIIPTPSRIVSVTQVVKNGSPLHGIVNSDYWDQSQVGVDARGEGYNGSVTKFRGNSLVIPTGHFPGREVD